MDQNTVLSQNNRFKSLKQVKTCIVSKNKFKRGKTAKNSFKSNAKPIQEVHKVLNAGAGVCARACTHTCAHTYTHAHTLARVHVRTNSCARAGAHAYTTTKKNEKKFFYSKCFLYTTRALGRARAHTRTGAHAQARTRSGGRAGAGAHDPLLCLRTPTMFNDRDPHYV
jgi:hypothetical protein